MEKAIRTNPDRTAVHASYLEFYGADDASPRSIDQYIATVRDGWRREAEGREPDEREREKQAFLAELQEDIVLFTKEKAWASRTATRKMMMRVRGLDAQTVNLTGDVRLTAARADEDRPLTAHEISLAAEVVREEQAKLALADAPTTVDAEVTK